MLRTGLALLLLTLLAPQAHGQEPHIHGVTVPDWYDSDCCSNRDCNPVEREDVEEIEGGAWKHLPTGFVFKGKQIRPSHDSRFHVCIWNGQPMCIYIVQGM